MKIKRQPHPSRRSFIRGALSTLVAAPLATRVLRAGDDPFLRSPNVQNVSANGASVLWSLPSPVASSIVVTDSSGSSQTVPASLVEFDPAQTGMAQTYFQYRADVSGLSPNSTYKYSVVADGQTLNSPLLNSQQIQTTPSGPFKFLHFADSGEGNDEQIQLSRQIMGEDSSLVLANGDLAYDYATCGSVESNYYGIYRQMMANVPFFATLGNHEYYSSAGAPSLAARVTPTNNVPYADWGRYYSFDWGNVHFVALDTNAPLTSAVTGKGQMLNWLDKDLQSTRKFWRVVYFHHPGYATGKHQYEPEAYLVRQYVVPILEKYGVQLVLNGHEHTYQRSYELLGGDTVAANSGGIVYITSGGGGADTYWTAPDRLVAQSIGQNNYLRGEVTGSQLTMHARGLGVDADIDSVVLAPPPIAVGAVNGMNYGPRLNSGGLVSIFGRNLCPDDVLPVDANLMMAASGTTVTLNGSPIPLTFAGANQVNALIPLSFSGPASLAVSNANGVSQLTVYISA